MEFVVSKFGGSSLAESAQFKKVIDIINEDEKRKYIVVSAPGKFNANDKKITDVLFDIFYKSNKGIKYDENISYIKNRFEEIIKGLNIDFDIESELSNICNEFDKKKTLDYIASRGEYLNAKILSIALNTVFVDAKDLIFFKDDGVLDYEKTYKTIYDTLSKFDKKVIIPGFYGICNNNIKIFKRGGSDITGSLVARAMNVKIYENWTDVDGVLFADPRIVENKKVLKSITYKELRELAYMGATVLHEDAIYPVSSTDICINILNTNDKSKKGTFITNKRLEPNKDTNVTGIAGKNNFVSINVEKSLMNSEVGFIVKLLDIFKNHKIPVEHCPTGIDTISVIIEKKIFDELKDEILNEINEKIKPDKVTVDEDMALIAVVGYGVTKNNDSMLKIFTALNSKDIKIKMIDLSPSSINIIIAVSNDDYKAAIRYLCDSLCV